MLFDIGHGMGSLSFDVARKMLAAGFPPDTISSDVHALCVDGPAFDLTTTMSKFLCLGMPLREVIGRATQHAAKALRRPDLGSLAVGSVGDATIMSVDEGKFDYIDSVGAHLAGRQSITPHGIVVNGRLLEPTTVA